MTDSWVPSDSRELWELASQRKFTDAQAHQIVNMYDNDEFWTEAGLPSIPEIEHILCIFPFYPNVKLSLNTAKAISINFPDAMQLIYSRQPGLKMLIRPKARQIACL